MVTDAVAIFVNKVVAYAVIVFVNKARPVAAAVALTVCSSTGEIAYPIAVFVNKVVAHAVTVFVNKVRALAKGTVERRDVTGAVAIRWLLGKHCRNQGYNGHQSY
jgi:hypothetical protein